MIGEAIHGLLCVILDYSKLFMARPIFTNANIKLKCFDLDVFISNHMS